MAFATKPALWAFSQLPNRSSSRSLCIARETLARALFISCSSSTTKTSRPHGKSVLKTSTDTGGASSTPSSHATSIAAPSKQVSQDFDAKHVVRKIARAETLDVFEFIARVLTQIPEPRKHNIHYYGAYASKTRTLRKKDGSQLQPASSEEKTLSTDEPKLSSKQRAALRKRWANLIKRVFKTDPLLCDCGGTFRILSFITEPTVIAKIVDHLAKNNSRSRAPPELSQQPHFS